MWRDDIWEVEDGEEEKADVMDERGDIGACRQWCEIARDAREGGVYQWIR